MTIKQVLENLQELEVSENIEADVIEAFEDYSFEGVASVIVSKDKSNSNIDYQAYIDKKNSPIIKIKIKNNKINAWI
jgi:hypothetical protein